MGGTHRPRQAQLRIPFRQKTRPEVATVKNSIGSVIIRVSVLISCCGVYVGCHPAPAYIGFSTPSGVLQPTFCLYRDPYFQEQLGIVNITVWKVSRPTEAEQRLEPDPPWDPTQTVWALERKPTDNIVTGLWWVLSTPVVPCLTYGEVPPGYEATVKAVPLEPEQLYGIRIFGTGLGGTLSTGVRFSIRVDETGIPDRLEYHPTAFFSDFDRPQVFLKLQ